MISRRWIKECTPKDLTDLQIAVCLCAADDYREGLQNERKLRKKATALMAKERRGKRLSSSEENLIKDYLEKRYNMVSAKRFFESEWGMVMSPADGRNVIRMLDHEYA